MKKRVLISVGAVIAVFVAMATHEGESEQKPSAERRRSHTLPFQIQSAKQQVKQDYIHPVALLPESSRLQDTVKLALKITSDPRLDAEAEDLLRAQAQSLSQQELREIQKVVVDSRASHALRDSGIYILTEAGPRALPELAIVAATQVPKFSKAADPHSADATKRDFEMSLRIRALEAIDRATAEHKETIRLLETVVARQTDRTLNFFAAISLQGIQQGRPGKLGRYVDQMLSLGEK